MFRTLIAGALAAVAWLSWHIIGDVVGDAFGLLLGPVTRPVWRAIVKARSPWPLFAMLAIGLGSIAAGLLLMGATGWRTSVGALLFFGGAGVTIMSPLLWRDAKREATRSASVTSRPVA